MKNCILINSYPINDEKINRLYTQILNLKTSNIPIILCSGCEVPSKIYNEVDYVIINKKKIIKSALYQKRKFLEGKDYVSACYNRNSVIFNDFVDLTITENIKLLFSTAKFFGYENVMYAEDDNVFVNADDYIKSHLNILNTSQSKMCAIITDFIDGFRGIHTNHFFANVQFLLENYTFPHDSRQLDDFEHLKPWQCYEMSIFRCFENQLKDIHMIDVMDRNQYLDLSQLFTRDNSVEYIINQRFVFIKNKNGLVRAYVHNTSDYLNLHIHVSHKNSSYSNEFFNPGAWYVTEPVELGDSVKIQITDQKSKKTLVRKIIYRNDDDILSLEV